MDPIPRGRELGRGFPTEPKSLYLSHFIFLFRTRNFDYSIFPFDWCVLGSGSFSFYRKLLRRRRSCLNKLFRPRRSCQSRQSRLQNKPTSMSVLSTRYNDTKSFVLFSVSRLFISFLFLGFEDCDINWSFGWVRKFCSIIAGFYLGDCIGSINFILSGGCIEGLSCGLFGRSLR